MQYNTFTNRLGKILVSEKVFTPSVKKLLIFFNKFNESVHDQNELIHVVSDAIEKVDIPAEDLANGTAIFLNAKNYLIEDKDQLISDLEKEGMELFVDKHGCIQRLGCGSEINIAFIPNEKLDKFSITQLSMS